MRCRASSLVGVVVSARMTCARVVPNVPLVPPRQPHRCRPGRCSQHDSDAGGGVGSEWCARQLCRPGTQRGRVCEAARPALTMCWLLRGPHVLCRGSRASYIPRRRWPTTTTLRCSRTTSRSFQRSASVPRKRFVIARHVAAGIIASHVLPNACDGRLALCQVAASVLFLLSPAASFITGTCGQAQRTLNCQLTPRPRADGAPRRSHHARGRRLQPVCIAVAHPTAHRHASVRRPARGAHQRASRSRQGQAEVQVVREINH